jgi:protein-S-isoprenylcysteine O-methyltransferase Ste14
MNSSKQLRAILQLPFIVVIMIPVLLILFFGKIHAAWSLSFPWNLILSVLGVISGAFGLLLMVQTIALFAKVGKGTLAPWDATQNLVVLGPYRHTRNPMITGVLLILFGEAIFLGSIPIVCWFTVFLVSNWIYIPLVEERGLEKRFGEAYRIYQTKVPRWLPHLRAWEKLFQSTKGGKRL